MAVYFLLIRLKSALSPVKSLAAHFRIDGDLLLVVSFQPRILNMQDSIVQFNEFDRSWNSVKVLCSYIFNDFSSFVEDLAKRKAGFL